MRSGKKSGSPGTVTGAVRAVSWKSIFRFFAAHYGWGPDAVSALTPAQVVFYGDKDGKMDADDLDPVDKNRAFVDAVERLKARTGRETFPLSEVVREMVNTRPR